MKTWLILVLLFVAPLTLKAQPNIGSVPRYGQTDVVYADKRINELPRYGRLPKTPQMLAADEHFVAEAISRCGSAQNAAQEYVNVGWHYLNTDRVPTAIKRFNQAWLLDSTAADVYFGFSAYLRHEKKVAEAEQFMRLGQQRDTGNVSLVRYYSNIARGQELRRDYTGALATLNQILQMDSRNVFAHRTLGYLYMEQDTARASYHLTQALQLDPQDSISYLNRGWVRCGQKRYPAAIADFTQAIRINQHFISAYTNRALAFLDSNDPKAADADWQQCLKLIHPREKGHFYAYIGAKKLQANDKAGACEAFRSALQWGDTPAAEKKIRKLIKSNCQ